jgi:hypothetical protein
MAETTRSQHGREKKNAKAKKGQNSLAERTKAKRTVMTAQILERVQ